MKSLLRRCLPLLTLLISLSGAASASQPVVMIVSSEGGAAYQEAIGALQAELARGGIAPRYMLALTVAEFTAQGGQASGIQVALGAEACAQLAPASSHAPVLCALLPRTSFERILREQGRRVGPALSALYLNQPLGRQLDLVRLALPQARRVGVLWGSDSQQGREAGLDAAAQARGLRIIGVTVRPGEPVYSALKKVLDESDVLLALADPQIYNSASIQNILLASFRAQVPMLAFSPSYVRAGALLAVHSSPSQIGLQAAQMARAVLQGQVLGAPQYPAQFEVSVNEHVARALGLQLDITNLTERLRRLERGP